MAVGVRFVDGSYSLSGNIATVSFTFELYDDSILDDNGVPVALDVKTVTVRQNILDPNARANLKSKLENEIKVYLEKAKDNMNNILLAYGTLKADDILAIIQGDIEADLPAIIASVFG